MNQQQSSFLDTFKLYIDKRIIIIFLLGISSGFPWVIIGSAMSAWLKESDLTRSAIGFFGTITAVYAVNFLWAPLLDRVRIPLLGRLGQRRSWIMLMQLFLLIGVVAISFTDPKTGIIWTSLIALTIAIASATQDVAIDAYRIESISPEDQKLIPIGSAMATSGWWTGYSLPGALAFILADFDGWNWSDVYRVMALFLVALISIIFFIKEPNTSLFENQKKAETQYGKGTKAWLLVTIVEPFREFFSRNGVKIALLILSFIFLFKIGEAFLGRMSIVFYKEVGFTNTEIGTYSKLIGWWVVIVFSIIGGIVNSHFGIIKGLFIGGIAMAASNLMFAWIAVVGPDTNLFLATVIVDGFTGAFATVTFVSFLSYLTSRSFTATQYALMASLGNLARTTLSSFSGVMVDKLDGNWSLFFIITAIMVIPSLLMLLVIAKHIKVVMSNNDN